MARVSLNIYLRTYVKSCARAWKSASCNFQIKVLDTSSSSQFCIVPKPRNFFFFLLSKYISCSQLLCEDGMDEILKRLLSRSFKHLCSNICSPLDLFIIIRFFSTTKTWENVKVSSLKKSEMKLTIHVEKINESREQKISWNQKNLSSFDSKSTFVQHSCMSIYPS